MKKIFSVIFIAALLFALCGCGAAEDTGPDEFQNGDEFPNGIEEMSLVIKNIDDGSYKAALIKEINLSKTAREEDARFGVYAQNEISDIQEFYYPSVKIDGYDLYCVEVSKSSFHFYFAPVEELNKEQEYFYTLKTGILITIRRPGYVDAADPLRPLIEQLNQQGKDYLAEDNILYIQSHNDITAQIFNTWFGVRMPDELNNYDYLRALCFNIIDSIEVVVLEK
ncbi:MAG: hypothetical protein FWD39_00985 [Clostridiales bacterium]|nr:hypothetical protein [Clostridiales bacterium]